MMYNYSTNLLRQTVGQPGAPTTVPRAMMVLVAIMSGKRCSLESLADTCKCTTKTIQRTLDKLRDAGFDIYYDYDRKSYALDGEMPFPVLSIELAEATALSLAESTLDALGEPDLNRALDNALEKIQHVIPRRQAKDWHGCRNALTAEGLVKRDYSKAPIHAIIAAIREQKVVEVDYESISSGRRTRQFNPYAVAFLNGFWMVIAYDPWHKDVRKFALDRVYDCRPVTPERRFKIPEDWSLKEYLALSVGVLSGEPTKIKLRFQPESRVFLERRLWNFPHELSKPDSTGRVILTGEVSGLEEISREILRWGRFVTVLEPPALREMVVSEAKQILKNNE